MGKKLNFNKHGSAVEELEEGNGYTSESLEAFFAQNMSQEGLEREIVVSERFTDSEGTPIPWKVRALSDNERNAIMQDCMITKTVRLKSGRTKTAKELDAILFQSKLRAAAVVFPDLDNEALQNSYGVRCAEDLLGVMLTAAEGTRLLAEVNGIGDIYDEELEEEAKNS